MADARRLDRETNGPGFAYPLTSTSTESYNRRFGIAPVATVEGGNQGDGGFVIPLRPYVVVTVLRAYRYPASSGPSRFGVA